MTQITELLRNARSGHRDARDALFAAAYDELVVLARSRLRSGGRNTLLDTAALVHESYLRFLSAGSLRAEDRHAFFAYAAQVMRSVIVDCARERLAERRGGGAEHLTLNWEQLENLPAGEEEILRVHEALEVLAQAEPRLAVVVEMRYFGGYSEAEMAEALEVDERTIRRSWAKARLLLKAAMK